MKLNKLTIKNFRGIKGSENSICFDSSDVIFLIGQNNVGKSSFLKAYEIFVKSSYKPTAEDFHNYDTSIPIEMEGWFIKESIDDTDADLCASGKSIEPDWIDKWVDKSNTVKIKKIWELPGQDFRKQTFDPKSNKWSDNGFGGLHTKLQKYSPTPILISAIETEESLEKKINELINKRFLKKIETTDNNAYKAIMSSIRAFQKEITSCLEIVEFNDKLNKEFRKVFSNLTLQIKPKSDDGIDLLKAFEKNHSMGVKKDGVEREENFTQHGHGVIRQALFNFLKFLCCLDGDDIYYLILFEEPEIFLHPKTAFNLRKSLYELAADKQFQVLCATHSPLMIDISKPNSSLIRVVKNVDETTATYQADQDIFQGDEERKSLVQMINRFNPHVCEAFYADKVLLVEGDTEAIVYRELLTKFYPNEEMFVLNTGSKNNIPFFQEILTHFKIEHYIIHDSDERQTSDGKKNPAWKLNEVIWKKVEAANLKKDGLARRYVHVKNFELANGYMYDLNKGKPLSAYEFAQEVTEDQNISCLNWLNDIMKTKNVWHDQAYIEVEIDKYEK